MSDFNNTISSDVIRNANTLSCECGNKIFLQGVVFKEISKLITGSPENEVMQIAVFYCKECGKIPKNYDKEGVLLDELKTTK